MADSTAERYERARLDIDTRLLDIWQLMGEILTEEEIQTLCHFLRWAYYKGYKDALTEPHGKLPADHGFPVPPKFDESAK